MDQCPNLQTQVEEFFTAHEIPK